MTTKGEGSFIQPLVRVPTGVPGIDTILNGGLFQGGVYIVKGSPGSGKTIFGNQVCFGHAASGKRALYITLLAEFHTRMLQHMQTMAFFDPKAIPDALYYVSAFRFMEEDGFKGLMELIRREMAAHGATMLVLDGVTGLVESSESEREYKKFIHELQAHVAAEDCTVLLLTSAGMEDRSPPESTMVDGIIELRDSLFGARGERELEVRKLRGTAFLRGLHLYRITDAGIVAYPRIEAHLSRPSREASADQGLYATGIGHLDAMLGGGLPSSTMTLIFGPGGCGKTSLGLYFLSKSSKKEPGLVFTFHETPERLSRQASHLGIELSSLVDAGHLEEIWQAPTEDLLDAVGGRLLEAVRRRGVRRLFIDGLAGFATIAARPERLTPFLAALANELRVLGVTTLCTLEMSNLFGPVIEAPMPSAGAIIDNLIVLRFVELHAHLHRLLSILKVQGSPFDSSLREFRIGRGGLVLADTFESAEGVMTGVAHMSGPERAPVKRTRSRPET